MAFLAHEGLKAQSIKVYLSAIHRLQVVLGLGDPFQSQLPLLEYILKGIKSDQAKLPSGERTRLPITPGILDQLHSVWNREARKADNIISVPSLTAYDPGAHLSVGDVTRDKAVASTMVQVNIKASKTDPFRKEVSVFLGRTVGRVQWQPLQHTWLCVVVSQDRSSSSWMAAPCQESCLWQE